MAQIMEAITKMEGVTGKKFGDKENPLLVSVRSGARASVAVPCPTSIAGFFSKYVNNVFI